MRIKFILFLIFTGLQSSAQHHVQAYHQGNDSSRKLLHDFFATPEHTLPMAHRISELNAILEIDSNFYLVYVIKCSFQFKTRKYDSAFLTIKKLIKLEPDIAENYSDLGILYEIQRDTVLAMENFQIAEKLFDRTKETCMDKNERDRFLFTKALNLIYVGKFDKGTAIFKDLFGKTENLNKRVATYIYQPRKEAINITIENYDNWH